MSTETNIHPYYNNNGQNSLVHLTEEENLADEWVNIYAFTTSLVRITEKNIWLEISWGMENREMGFEEAPTVRCSLTLT